MYAEAWYRSPEIWDFISGVSYCVARHHCSWVIQLGWVLPTSRGQSTWSYDTRLKCVWHEVDDKRYHWYLCFGPSVCNVFSIHGIAARHVTSSLRSTAADHQTARVYSIMFYSRPKRSGLVPGYPQSIYAFKYFGKTKAAIKTSTEYELVQAERPKLCQPRTPLAIDTRMPHIWHHTDRHKQREGVT